MSEMSFFAKSIMEQKYAHDLEDGRKETWPEIADRVSHHVLKAINLHKSPYFRTPVFHCNEFVGICMAPRKTSKYSGSS